MKLRIFLLPALFAAASSRAELGFSFSFDEQVQFGNDLRWCVSVTNTTETTGTVAVAFCVDWLQYNGQSLASVAKLVVTNALAPQSFTNIECRVPVSTYRSFLTVSETFECSAAAWNVDNEDNEDIELLRSFVRADNEPLILITPTPIPAPGETASVIVEWTNSTPFTIHADFAVALASGLRTTDGRWLCEWATRIIPPGLVCSLQTNVVVVETDALSATVYMTSDSYPPVEKTLVLDE